MTTNNSINSGILATDAEALLGTDQKKLITPSTLKYALDNVSPYPRVFWNVSINIVGSTFAVRDMDGVPYSSGGSFQLMFSSATNAGLTVPVTINNDQGFAFSDLNGNLFGTEASVAWSNDKPFFLYAVVNDARDHFVFGISAVPNHGLSPTTLSKAGLTSATTQGSMFLLEDVTLTEYDNNPIVLLGSFRMTKNSSDQWTVTAFDHLDGIDLFQDNRYFTMPTGQQGATNYLLANGGTVPTFTTNVYRYWITPDGICDVLLDFNGDGGVSGAGAVSLQCVLPYGHGQANIMNGCVELVLTGASGSGVLEMFSGPYFQVYKTPSPAYVQYLDIASASRAMNGFLSYVVSKV